MFVMAMENEISELVITSSSQPAILALLFFCTSKNLNCFKALSSSRLEESLWFSVSGKENRKFME